MASFCDVACLMAAWAVWLEYGYISIALQSVVIAMFFSCGIKDFSGGVVNSLKCMIEQKEICKQD